MVIHSVFLCPCFVRPYISVHNYKYYTVAQYCPNWNKLRVSIEEYNDIHWARAIFRMSGDASLISAVYIPRIVKKLRINYGFTCSW